MHSNFFVVLFWDQLCSVDLAWTLYMLWMQFISYQVWLPGYPGNTQVLQCKNLPPPLSCLPVLNLPSPPPRPSEPRTHSVVPWGETGCDFFSQSAAWDGTCCQGTGWTPPLIANEAKIQSLTCPSPGICSFDLEIPPNHIQIFLCEDRKGTKGQACLKVMVILKTVFRNELITKGYIKW